MAGMQQILKKAAGNKIIQYLFSKYAVYGIQFINSIFIAQVLGPFYLGIWGFVNLVVTYFTQMDFGTATVMTVLGSKHKQDRDYINKLFTHTIYLTSILMLLAIGLLIANQHWNLFGDKYDFNKYMLPALITIAMSYFIPVLSGYLRIMGNIRQISLIQLLQPLGYLLVSFFFSGEDLLWALLWSGVVTSIISVSILLKQAGSFKWRRPSWGFAKTMLHTAMYLFIYTTAFYFIVISARSIVSNVSTIEQFGYFTFAFSLANIVTLLLKSFSFLIFPKVINRLAAADSEKGIQILTDIRKTYIVSAHLLMHILMLVFPLFVYFVPKYAHSLQCFQLILIATILYANSMGYQGLLLAKGKEKLIAGLSTTGLVINIIGAWTIAQYFPYQYIILGTGIAYIVYVWMLAYNGRKTLEMSTKFMDIVKDAFPLSIFIPYLISLLLILFSSPYPYFTIPVVVYVLLNIPSFKKIVTTLKNIIRNPNFVNV